MPTSSSGRDIAVLLAIGEAAPEIEDLAADLDVHLITVPDSEDLGDLAEHFADGLARLYANELGVSAETEVRRAAYDSAIAHYRNALSLYEEIGDVPGMAKSHQQLGDISIWRRDLISAQEHYQRALSLYEEISDSSGLAASHERLGDISLSLTDLSSAHEHYRRALSLYEEAGDVSGEATAHQDLGNTLLAGSDLDGADKQYRRALSLYEEAQDFTGIASCHQRLGDISLSLNEPSSAREHMSVPWLFMKRRETPPVRLTAFKT